MYDKAEAEKRYKNFITWLYVLIFEQKNNFDLIIAPANSGIFLVESVRLFYQIQGLVPPKILIMPIQRREIPGTDEGKHFDNSVVSDSIKPELSDLNRLKNVLFVDDEIGRAYTPKEAILVILMSVDTKIISDRVLFTILAENHGFEWRYDLPPVAIRYFAFANKFRNKREEPEQNINGSIFYIMDDTISDKYKGLMLNLNEKLTKPIGKKELAALFSNGLIQTSKNMLPILTNELLEEVKREIPDFDSDKEIFMDYTKSLIKDVIGNLEEYKKAQIFQD